MIPKNYEKNNGDTFVNGGGLPFDVPTREPIEKSDSERNRPVVIHLGDLNGGPTAKGMPKNFSRKAGRTVPTFTKYWTGDTSGPTDSYDIE